MKLEEESGRSMVEMLGVLAIIGVLSVAGISGYTTAMNKHRANELMNNVSMLAIFMAPNAENIPNNEITLKMRNEYGLNIIPQQGDGQTFQMEMTSVPKDICKQIMNIGAGMSEKVEVNESVVWENGVRFNVSDCSKDINSVKYTFNDSLICSSLVKNSDGNGNSDERPSG